MSHQRLTGLCVTKIVVRKRRCSMEAKIGNGISTEPHLKDALSACVDSVFKLDAVIIRFCALLSFLLFLLCMLSFPPLLVCLLCFFFCGCIAIQVPSKQCVQHSMHSMQCRHDRQKDNGPQRFSMSNAARLVEADSRNVMHSHVCLTQAKHAQRSQHSSA